MSPSWGMWLFAVLGVLAVCVMFRSRDMVGMQSNVTGKQYSVRKAPDSQAMADRLATLEQRLHQLLDGADSVVPGDPRIAAIRRKWDGTLAEVEASDEVAFSVDKASIHVCLRNSAGAIEDLNTSMFVLLHELAHVATPAYGHTDEFWANMRFLLELAERLRLYVYENYDAAATTFCGHPLGASPLTCVKDSSCQSTLGGS